MGKKDTVYTAKQRVYAYYREDEARCVQACMEAAQFTPTQQANIDQLARDRVAAVRRRQHANGCMDALLQQYDLSCEAGIVLMCLAEALLRVPDKATQDKLIQDKLTAVSWRSHAQQHGQIHQDFLTHTTTWTAGWGLTLASKLYGSPERAAQSSAFLKIRKRLSQLGAPCVRTVMHRAMQLLSHQFVLGDTIETALARAAKTAEKNTRFSYDMLGEAARTLEQATQYFEQYQQAIAAIGKHPTNKQKGTPSRCSAILKNMQAPGISVKLSALYPRYCYAQAEQAVPFLADKLLALATQAKKQHIHLVVDAEESDRLALSMDILERVFTHPTLSGWGGLGLAVQAYQKRALPLLDWLIALSRQHDTPWIVRLVKGAYWDTEIKDTQVRGLCTYPVYTRKAYTDISYLACAKKMAEAQGNIYPQFATHHAYSAAAVKTLMQDRNDYEFQRLHGMGEDLYADWLQEGRATIPGCRVYAPVGPHAVLLPYLVRRLLENGANTSFVNRILRRDIPVDTLVENPLEIAKQFRPVSHPHIPAPAQLYRALYKEKRNNAPGIDFTDPIHVDALTVALNKQEKQLYLGQPLMKGVKRITRSTLFSGTTRTHANHTSPVCAPFDFSRCLGHRIMATTDQVDTAINTAHHAVAQWQSLSVTARAALLDKVADQLIAARDTLLYLLVYEAGKNWEDAQAEWREAIDFCHYYAMQARHTLVPQPLPGPTGEENRLFFTGRGVLLCISPWNFPLAIFTGQIVAAVVAGNTVIAKPATQTTLIATQIVMCLYRAGIPETVVQLLPGDTNTVGAPLVAHPDIAGVLLTGSTHTARTINQQLAKRPGPIIPLIAETGGQNALIADSTALPEQLVTDVMDSAWGSAGQRCSALRILFIQDSIANTVIDLLNGAARTLVIGDPRYHHTDIGPIIDDTALQRLTAHLHYLQTIGAKKVVSSSLASSIDPKKGYFFLPCAYEIQHLSQLKEEVFGPILHIIRYKQENIDDVIKQINHTGFGLTLGVHSRIQHFATYLFERIRAGNVYVNRNMVGAVVGVQPFGGQGLSGTGPKAGGPLYLQRLCHERTRTINTAAIGGNASLINIEP